MNINSKEVDIISLDVQSTGGSRVITTMGKGGQKRGVGGGVKHVLKLVAAIPLDSEIDWWGIKNALITIHPIERNGTKIAYGGCYTTGVGRKFSIEGEAQISLDMIALTETL